MGAFKRIYPGAVLLLLFLQAGAEQSIMAQVQGTYNYPASTATVTSRQSPETAAAVKHAEEQYRAELHRKALADADRMVQLAGQLKIAIDKSTSDTVSADVIKKADEIETLARAMKKETKF